MGASLVELKENQILLYVLPPDDDISLRTYGNKDYAYFVAILPRGYHFEHDSKGDPILPVRAEQRYMIFVIPGTAQNVLLLITISTDSTEKSVAYI